MKRTISLDSLILFFVVLINMVFFSIGEGRNPIFFLILTLSFLLLAIYLIVDASFIPKEDQNLYKLLIAVFLWFIIFGTFFLSSLINRQKEGGGIKYIADPGIAVEEATKTFLRGNNPYSVDYLNTNLEKWQNGYINVFDKKIENPAIYHYAYLPFSFLISAPFYTVTNKLIGWYDQRIINFLFFLLSAYFLYKIPKDKTKKLIVLILFAFNPIFYHYSLLNGNNDPLVFFWVILSLYFLTKDKLNWSLISFALAFATKQTIWLLAPFYFFYIYQKEISTRLNYQGILSLTKKITPFLIVVILVIVPFLVWDFNSFVDDTIKYLSGHTEISYPITGKGFSSLLYTSGIIKDFNDYFPFWIFQILFCLPLFIYFLKLQKQDNTLSRMMGNYSLILFIFLIFSRFFSDSYFGVLMQNFVLVYSLNPENFYDF